MVTEYTHNTQEMSYLLGKALIVCVRFYDQFYTKLVIQTIGGLHYHHILLLFFLHRPNHERIDSYRGTVHSQLGGIQQISNVYPRVTRIHESCRQRCYRGTIFIWVLGEASAHQMSVVHDETVLAMASEMLVGEE